MAWLIGIALRSLSRQKATLVNLDDKEEEQVTRDIPASSYTKEDNDKIGMDIIHGCSRSLTIEEDCVRVEIV